MNIKVNRVQARLAIVMHDGVEYVSLVENEADTAAALIGHHMALFLTTARWASKHPEEAQELIDFAEGQTPWYVRKASEKMAEGFSTLWSPDVELEIDLEEMGIPKRFYHYFVEEDNDK